MWNNYNNNKENKSLEDLFWDSISKLEEKDHPDIDYFINCYQNSSYINELEFAEFAESYEKEVPYE